MSASVTLLGMIPLLIFIILVVAILSTPFFIARFGIRAMQKRGAEKLKPLLLIAAGVLFVMILVQVVPLVTFLGYGIHHGLKQRHNLDRAIEHDLSEIVTACLSLRQYLANDQDVVSIDRGDKRLPDIINRTNCRDVQISQRIIEIEMHGGMDHFGIRLDQDQSDTNVWQVLRYWEGGNEHLMTITNTQEKSINLWDDIGTNALNPQR